KVSVVKTRQGYATTLKRCRRKGEPMTDLEIIIFAIAGVAIILISLYVVISMTRDINATIHKCKEIEDWAKNELERRTDE
ncbi:MAG: hypothetical protein IKH14_05870, partial [Prevotella sp.]|nr:hypothetical protein [Prevotella sp.]